jgi:hypothetical protein
MSLQKKLSCKTTYLASEVFTATIRDHVGAGHFLSVAPVCKCWKTLYLQLFNTDTLTVQYLRDNPWYELTDDEITKKLPISTLSRCVQADRLTRLLSTNKWNEVDKRYIFASCVLAQRFAVCIKVDMQQMLIENCANWTVAEYVTLVLYMIERGEAYPDTVKVYNTMVARPTYGHTLQTRIN